MKKEIEMNFGKSIDGSIQPNLKTSIYINRSSEKQGLLWFSENLKASGFSRIFKNQKIEIQKQLDKLNTEFGSESIPNSNDYFNFVVNEDYLNNQLLALSEMNIIYNYKEYEINLKKLIKNTYNFSGQFYQWEKVKEFFSNKGILISKLDGYIEVQQLVNLNNHIKHNSVEISDKIKDIPEFKNLSNLNAKVINEFYDRIKSFPFILIQGISEEIYKNLYEFNPEQIKKLAEKYALRMEKDDAQLFIKEFSKLY